MFKKIILATILLIAVVTVNAQQQHRVIVQIASNDTIAWKGLMNNIKNLKSVWGDSVTIFVVAHGPGLDLLTKGKTNQLQNISLYRKMGVTFNACEKSMEERKVPKEMIIEDAGFVKMAVAEIVARQEQGWSYYKAGF